MYERIQNRSRVSQTVRRFCMCGGIVKEASITKCAHMDKHEIYCSQLDRVNKALKTKLPLKYRRNDFLNMTMRGRIQLKSLARNLIILVGKNLPLTCSLLYIYYKSLQLFCMKNLQCRRRNKIVSYTILCIETCNILIK